MATGTGYLGRVIGRLESDDCPQFLGALAVFLVFYTLLFESIKEYDVTLTASGIRCPYTISIAVLMLATTGTRPVRQLLLFADKLYITRYSMAAYIVHVL
jgi:hypothetical protein